MKHKMPIIIDGYNLLHSIQKNSEQFDSISDLTLCRILDVYLKKTDQKGCVVFDGIGPPDKNGFDAVNFLEVFFSGTRLDADTVIENKIKSNSAPKGLKVVSDDRRLRDAARRRKAISVRCDNFWVDVQRALSRDRLAAEPAEKQTGLNEIETKLWLKFFGIEK